MEDAVKQTIETHQLLDKGDGVIVGLSGGADSSALLVVLKKLSAQLDLKLAAIHVNHQLRGEEALRDQYFSEQLCKRLEIPIKVVNLDVSALAKEKGISFELAGREVRYDAFETYRLELGYQKIAVAHHLNDQAETVLQRLIRGSGLEGLAGMRPRRDSVIIRPLLYVSRSDIEAFCQSEKIEIMVDHTNLETEYSRNFIRLRLIPQIDQRFQTSVSETISRTAALLAQDADFFEIQVDALWRDLVIQESGTYQMKCSELMGLHPALQGRLIRRLFKAISGQTTDLSHVHVSQILRICSGNEEKCFVYKYVAFTACGGLLRTTMTGQERTCQHKNENKPNIVIETVTDLRNMGIKKEEMAIYVDASAIKGQLSLRHRQSGDRFKPWGMMGHKKLKDFFVDLKVPREERDQIWLLCDEEKILWVCGWRQSEDTRVTELTNQILKVSLSEVVSQN